jgi:acyl-CoA synthetase (AMP-forming)/AMP-acid ligase II
LFGALRAGCTVFPLSTRNSDVATAHLIAESGIEYLLVSQDAQMQEIARKAKLLLNSQSVHIDLIPIPTYDEISTTQHTDLDPLPPLQPIDDERVIMIAHSSGENDTSQCSPLNPDGQTSGSTSFPKVIPFTHGYLQSAVKGGLNVPYIFISDIYPSNGWMGL